MEVERREKARGQEEGANKGTRGIEGSGQGRGGDRWWVWSGGWGLKTSQVAYARSWNESLIVGYYML